MSLIKVSNMFPPYRGCGWQRITHGGLVWVSGISSKDSNSEFSVDNVVSFLVEATQCHVVACVTYNIVC